MINKKYKVKYNAEISKFQHCMIINNEIDEFVNFKIIKRNKEIEYDISNYNTIENELYDVILITKILEQLINIYNKIDTYMLDIDNLDCSINKIYIDESNHLKMIYYPIKEDKNELLKQGENNFQKLIKRLLEEYSLLDANAKKQITEFINNNEFSIIKLSELLKDIKNNKEKEINEKMRLPVLCFLLFITITIIMIKEIYTKYVLIFAVLISLLMIINNKIKNKKYAMDSRDEDTEIIYDGMYLKDSIIGIKHVVNTERFLIGKNSKCNLIINNKTISNEHALIYKYGKKYYIRDLDSKNHTYINGIKLENDEVIKLSVGDIIKFSKSKYIVGM